VSEQCFTSPPTQYRLYGRRFLQVKRPNQQYQSTEGRSEKMWAVLFVCAAKYESVWSSTQTTNHVMIITRKWRSYHSCWKQSATWSESSSGTTASVSCHKYGKLRARSLVLYSVSTATYVTVMPRYSIMVNHTVRFCCNKADLTFVAHCCHMGTAIKHAVPVIFDIRALWYCCTHMATMGVKGLMTLIDQQNIVDVIWDTLDGRGKFSNLCTPSVFKVPC